MYISWIYEAHTFNARNQASANVFVKNKKRCCFTSKPSNTELTLNQVYFIFLQLSTKGRQHHWWRLEILKRKKKTSTPHHILKNILEVFHLIKMIINKSYYPDSNATVIWDYSMEN